MRRTYYFQMALLNFRLPFIAEAIKPRKQDRAVG